LVLDKVSIKIREDIQENKEFLSRKYKEEKA